MDKQTVNEAIVEKLCLKLNLWLLEHFSVFLCESVSIIMSFNNSHTVTVDADKGIPRLRESISF